MATTQSTLFLTKQIPIVPCLAPCNVILSPEFYWIIKRPLPVKSLAKAKRLAPSLFEGMLPKGNYDYVVTKKDDFFLIFAYDIDAITSYLTALGFNLRWIKAFYFAQNELSEEKHYQIGEKVLCTQEGLFIMFPANIFSPSLPIVNIKDLSLTISSHICIRLNKFLFSPMQGFNPLPIILMLFLYTLIVVGEIYLNHTRIEQENSTKESLLRRVKMPTTLQANALYQNLLEQFEQQKLFRDKIKLLATLPFQKEEFIQVLTFSKKRFTIECNIHSQKRINAIKDHLLSQGFSIKSENISKSKMTMELLYE